MDLSTLVKMSNTYGSNPAYVLAGGGNTSVKDDTTLYVKGSGTQLATIKADDCMATCGTINLDYRSLYHHFENGCFMADCQAVLDIRNDLAATMDECREVTEQYSTGRSAYLRLGQLFMRLFAGLL